MYWSLSLRAYLLHFLSRGLIEITAADSTIELAGYSRLWRVDLCVPVSPGNSLKPSSYTGETSALMCFCRTCLKQARNKERICFVCNPEKHKGHLHVHLPSSGRERRGEAESSSPGVGMAHASALDTTPCPAPTRTAQPWLRWVFSSSVVHR